jgi:hypothetical protein
VISARSWEDINVNGSVVDALVNDTLLIFATAGSVHSYNAKTSLLQPLNISAGSEIQCFSRKNDTLYICRKDGYTTYSVSAQTSGFLQHPASIKTPDVIKTFFGDTILVAEYAADYGIYDPAVSEWLLSKKSSARAKQKKLTWDDNGLVMRYAPQFSSSLKGTAVIPFDFRNDSLYDTSWVKDTNYETGFPITFNDTTIKTVRDVWTDPRYPRLNLTLHNQLGPERYADVFFNNTNTSSLPAKGVYYRGANTDHLQWARLGTNSFDISQSHSLPSVKYEGAAAGIDSRKKLETRDRKIVRTVSGAGYITEETKLASLPYNRDNIYFVSIRDLEQIVPGSVMIWIDGEELDSNEYTIYYLTGQINFDRSIEIDPTSAITISYKTRDVPSKNKLDTIVQFIPEPNKARFAFANVSVSPADWISPGAGYVYLDPGSLHHLVNLALPMEFRNEKMFLKFEPDFTRSITDGVSAGAASLSGNIGNKLSLNADALLADSNFTTTDNLDRGYGNIKRSLDFAAQFDILRQIPVRYKQHNSLSAKGTDRYHKLSTGVQFENYPMCELFVSRNVLNAGRSLQAFLSDSSSLRNVYIDSLLQDTEGMDSTEIDQMIFDRYGNHLNLDSMVSVKTDTITDDSVNVQKNKLGIKLFERSSPALEKLLHVNRLGYEFSLTEYRAESDEAENDGNGRSWYFQTTVSPIKQIVFTGYGTYRNHNSGLLPYRESYPVLQFQTMNAPRGIDFDGSCEWIINRYTGFDSATINVSRRAGIIMRPGEWLKQLNWLSPRASISRTISSVDTVSDVDAEYYFKEGENTGATTLSRVLGVRVYPFAGFLFQNENTWGTSPASETFKTFNDLKINFDGNTMWQAQWTFNRSTTDSNSDSHDGFTHFHKAWTSWFKTKTGVSGSFKSEGSEHNTSITPSLSLSFSLRDFLFIKSLTSNNSAAMTFNRHNGAFEQDIDESLQFYIIAVVKPNISIVTNHSLKFESAKFEQYTGRLEVQLIF